MIRFNYRDRISWIDNCRPMRDCLLSSDYMETTWVCGRLLDLLDKLKVINQ